MMQRSFLSASHYPILCALLLLGSALAGGQTTGRIQGTVTDSTGAAVPGVTVALQNENTGQRRNTTSSPTGDYSFLEVPVGTYRLEFDQAGFQRNVRRGITVELNQVLRLNIVMKVGAAEQVIDVSGEAPLVDTASTQLGAVVNDKVIETLPLNARDTYQLLQLQPGVQGIGGADLFYGSGEAGAVSVNGGRGRANNFSVNGGDGNDLFVNGPGIQPSPDSVQEFRVLTNTFDAEYGRNSGSVINVVTKSGTNNFHGNVYEFFRNRDLNARGYLDPFKPDNKQNVFGGTFGGPIKKDSTFFFASYEGRRLIQGYTSDPVVVPTAAQRDSVDPATGIHVGDFSATPFNGSLSSAVVAQTLNARGTCANDIAALGGMAPATGLAWNQIFPGNKIPISCMDPVAYNLMQNYVPSPNQPRLGNNVWQDIPIGRTQDDQGTFKVDHKLRSDQALSAYYYIFDSRSALPFTRFESLTPNLVSGFGNNNATRSQQLNLSHTWTVSPVSVNEARFTYFREAQGTFLHPQHTNLVQNSCFDKKNPANDAFLKSICFTGTTDVSRGPNAAITADQRLGITPHLGPGREGVPFVQIFGGFTIGNDYEGELPQIGNTYQWSDNFTHVVGKHTLKFGGDVRRMHFDQKLVFAPNGDYSYSGGGLSDFKTTDSQGNPIFIVNYLMGIPDSYLQGATQQERIRSTGFYLFGQDSWKIKPNLTLNYGLRWELNTPMSDSGKRVQTFRPGQADTIFPCQLSPDSQARLGAAVQDCGPNSVDPAARAVFPLGLVVPGDRGVPGGLTEIYYKSFAPRIGLAWSPDWNNKLTGGPGRTSIRMGFGIFYNPVEQLVLEQFQGEPPFGGSSLISEGLFMTPYLAQNCTVPCTATGFGSSPNPFFDVTTGIRDPKRGTPVDWSIFRPMILYGELQPNIRTQYADQYNLTIQREVGNSMVATVAYVGSQGHRLLATHDLNFGNPQTCLDINTLLGPGNCGPFSADFQYMIPGTTMVPAGFTLHLPYGTPSTITNKSAAPVMLSTLLPTGSTGINLVGLRQYSSPNCNPYTGVGCPADGVPVFTSIFAQDTIANSAYNSLQVSLERRLSKGVQFLAGYTFSKSLDNASTFEEILNPIDPRADRALSLFNARHRFVISYTWQPPVPKFEGAKGRVLNGWEFSGITTFQSGFPIRIISNSDQELMNSFDFNLPGRPNLVAPFTTQDPKAHNYYYFDRALFDDRSTSPGTLGNAPRTICCGPGIRNFDIAIHKVTPVNERVTTEFRTELFNALNHTQFLNPDGNITDGFYFGRVLHTRDPRLIQLALKVNF